MARQQPAIGRPPPHVRPPPSISRLMQKIAACPGLDPRESSRAGTLETSKVHFAAVETLIDVLNRVRQLRVLPLIGGAGGSSSVDLACGTRQRLGWGLASLPCCAVSVPAGSAPLPVKVAVRTQLRQSARAGVRPSQRSRDHQSPARRYLYTFRSLIGSASWQPSWTEDPGVSGSGQKEALASSSRSGINSILMHVSNGAGARVPGTKTYARSSPIGSVVNGAAIPETSHRAWGHACFPAARTQPEAFNDRRLARCLATFTRPKDRSGSLAGRVRSSPTTLPSGKGTALSRRSHPTARSETTG